VTGLAPLRGAGLLLCRVPEVAPPPKTLDDLRLPSVNPAGWSFGWVGAGNLGLSSSTQFWDFNAFHLFPAPAAVLDSMSWSAFEA